MGFRDYKEIAFEAGDILSAQMLEETYRYPREFLHRTYASHCNGIVTGLDFATQDDGVYLTAGIVKLEERYYILPQDVNLDEWLKTNEMLEGAEYYLCVVIAESDAKDCGIKFQQKAELEAVKAVKAEWEKPNNSLVLAKYKPRADRGISLPSLQMDNHEKPFEKFFALGLLQLLECEYAHPCGSPTYHPFVFRAVQNFLEQKKALSPYDFSLLMELQNHGVVAISSLKSYIAVNKKESPSSYDNMTRKKLFEELCECVQRHYTPVVYAEATPDAPAEKKREFHTKLI